MQAEIDQLSNELMAAVNDVDTALESGEDARELAAGKMVEELTARYQALLGKLAASERDRVEMRIGRRVTDLRRQAAQLTRRSSGQKTNLAVDAGSVPFLLQRTPGRTLHPGGAAVPRDRPKYSVGGEVEAWCGKCREIRTHHIVAMVGDEPRQVACQSCQSRHNFRTEPTRKSGPAAPVTLEAKRAVVAEDKDRRKREDAKRALQKELQDAPSPRPFDPKGRYKAGEIIVHPEHGRGKIENVLKSSLLVRFLEGLRPLDLS